MSTTVVIGGKNIKSTNTGSGESNIPDNYIFRITEDPTELSLEKLNVYLSEKNQYQDTNTVYTNTTFIIE